MNKATVASEFLAYCLLAIVPTTSVAHHSFAGFYDQDRIIEIAGVVTSVSWRNPHGSMGIDVMEPSGQTVRWQIETGSVSVLRVRGVNREFVKVGDRVRIAGEAALRNPTGLYARNMLLESGEEVLLSIGISPRWIDADADALLESQFSTFVAEAARRNASGIFRVWSTVFEDPDSFPMFKGGYPEDDAVRTIHMASKAARPSGYSSLLGHSTGAWDGSTLVVETTGVDAQYFDHEGTLQSPDARFVERFTLSEDQNRLDYRITVTDPVTFTETFELTRYWIWRPEL